MLIDLVVDLDVDTQCVHVFLRLVDNMRASDSNQFWSMITLHGVGYCFDQVLCDAGALLNSRSISLWFSTWQTSDPSTPAFADTAEKDVCVNFNAFVMHKIATACRFVVVVALVLLSEDVCVFIHMLAIVQNRVCRNECDGFCIPFRRFNDMHPSWFDHKSMYTKKKNNNEKIYSKVLCQRCVFFYFHCNNDRYGRE